MNCDLLMEWSIYCDYPLFRLHLERYHFKFKKVILYPSDHNREESFKDFLFDQVKETWVKDHTIDWTAPGVDWRQAEIEPMLPLSTAEWVYFVEPDWFVRDYNKFYSKVEDAIHDGADAVGYWNPTNYPYLHPASFFIKRAVLEKTQKDFRAHPEIPGCDHFAMITRDLEKLGAKIVTYQDLGLNCDVSPDADCFHLGGLTSNMIDSMLYYPNYEFHRPEAFYVYNWWSRKAKVKQCPEFISLSEKVEDFLLDRHSLDDIEPALNRWKEFFQ